MLEFLNKYSSEIQSTAGILGFFATFISGLIVWYFSRQSNRLQKDINLINFRSIIFDKAVTIIEHITSDIDFLNERHFKAAQYFVENDKNENLLEFHYIQQYEVLLSRLKDSRNLVFKIVENLDVNVRELQKYLKAFNNIDAIYGMKKGPVHYINSFQSSGFAVLAQVDASSMLHGLHEALNAIENIDMNLKSALIDN